MKKLFFLLSLIFFVNACNSVDNKSLTQVSTIDALLAGYYDGVMPLSKLTDYGDFGIGTFDKLDGEMIVLDGVIYQFKSDGKIHSTGLPVSSPFASVVKFQTTFTVPVKEGSSLSDLETAIDNSIPNKNLMYAIKVQGDFQFIKTRTIPAQQKPYKPLSEVTKTQLVFEKNDESGTLVGFLLPLFTSGINVPGYHLHFINSNHTFGGHVLGLTTGKVNVEIEEINDFYMVLPKDSEFGKVDLSKDRSKELNQVEKDK